MNDLDNNLASFERADKKPTNYLPITVLPIVSEYFQQNCNCPLIYGEQYVCSIYKNSIWYEGDVA